MRRAAQNRREPMRMDQTQRGWALGSLAFLAICTVAYLFYVWQSPTGPIGGSFMGLAIWRYRIRIHDIRRTAWGAQTSAHMEAGPRAGVDARTSLAGAAELAHDFVSRRLPFWRNANARLDVADDYCGGQRSLRRGAAELCPPDDDSRRSVGNYLRRNRQCAQGTAHGGRQTGGKRLRAAGAGEGN